MTPEQEAMIREAVASIIKGEAKLIEQMLQGRARKWLDFVLAEIAKEAPPMAEAGRGVDDAMQRFGTLLAHEGSPALIDAWNAYYDALSGKAKS